MKKNVQWVNDGGKVRLAKPVIRLQRVPPGIYSPGSDQSGWYLEPAAVVTDEMIDVPSEPINRVMDRVAQFRSARDHYRQYGVLYKTGILMYGPAACGKTSVLRRLGAQFVADGAIVLQAGVNSSFTATVLRGIRHLEPERLIVVEMEDVDAIAEYDEEGLLSLLDGASQIDGVVYLATTNKIAELPDRIKNRPSRMDDRVYVGPPDLACRTKYLLAKWPGSQWAATVEHVVRQTEGFSYGHLKEVVVSVGCLRREPDETIKRLRTMMEPLADEEKAAAADKKFLAAVGAGEGEGR